MAEPQLDLLHGKSGAAGDGEAAHAGGIGTDLRRNLKL